MRLNAERCSNKTLPEEINRLCYRKNRVKIPLFELQVGVPRFRLYCDVRYSGNWLLFTLSPILVDEIYVYDYIFVLILQKGMF